MKQASEAAKQTDIANAKEQIELKVLEKQLDGDYTISDLEKIVKEVTGNDMSEKAVTTANGNKIDLTDFVNEAEDGIVKAGEYASKISKYTDGKNIAMVPTGFTVSKIDGETEINKGLVIYQGDFSKSDWTSSEFQKTVKRTANQYVWIPCHVDGEDSNTKYKRTLWGVENDNGSNAENDEYNLLNTTVSDYDKGNGITNEIIHKIPSQIDNEKASVKKYGGFYIGRYETGLENGKAIIQQYKTPYAELFWKDAYKISNELDVGKNAKSYLCSSYARDTAINFIQNNSTFKNYATDRTDCNENWQDTEVKYVDANGVEQTKAKDTANRLPTGVTLAKCNIFDMGGNVAEFTTELHPLLNNDDDATVVFRGGHYNYSDSAGYRWDTYSARRTTDEGYRATLFIQ